MTELFLEIVTPSKFAFKGTVKSVTVPGTKGRFQVLKNHAPIISTIDIGLIKVELTEGKVNYYSTAGGTIEVLDNKVSVLADSIELVTDIDIDRAKQAMQRAEERLSARNNEINIARAQSALARATNRISIYNKYYNQ